MNQWDLIEKFGFPIVALAVVSSVFYRLFSKVIIPFFMKQIDRGAAQLDETNKAFVAALGRHDEVVTREFKTLHETLERKHRENMDRLDAIIRKAK